MRHVSFDISGVAGFGDWRNKKELIAKRIREVGIERIVWGSDGAFGSGITPAEGIAAYQELPLTPVRFRSINANLTPYMRKGRMRPQDPMAARRDDWRNPMRLARGTVFP
jgi:uncharacterized protein